MFIQYDNGPEYMNAKLKNWSAEKGIRLLYIRPGKPQQNAYIERYNLTVRYDWLARHLFDDLEQMQLFTTQWFWSYNRIRPHMALWGITPRQKLVDTA